MAHDAEAIEDWIRNAVAGVLDLRPQEVNVHKPIATYGVDSAEAAGLIGDMEDWLGCKIPLDLVWEWATTREIAERLAEYVASGAAEPKGAASAPADAENAA